MKVLVLGCEAKLSMNRVNNEMITSLKTIEKLRGKEITYMKPVMMTQQQFGYQFQWCFYQRSIVQFVLPKIVESSGV